MAQLTEESIFEAIQKDDIKGFDAQWGKYRLGRFPVLSLLYLYKSRKILSAYEESFLKIADFEVLHEPVSIYKAFAAKAGKSARLYLNEIVSPLEMLLILDKIRRLKRVYPLANASAAVKGRLKSIYSIKYSLTVKFEGNNIIIDRRPLSYGEKKRIATACLCSCLAVAVAVGVPVTTVALIPKRAEGEVTKLSHIDFASKTQYTLKNDITLPENFSVEKVSCKINGGGKKIIAGKGATLGELTGKINDVTIQSCGDPLFTSISQSAEIKNVTVNVVADIVSQTDTALVALTNNGTIDGVTVNISGKISAGAQSVQEGEELIFGGIVLTNAYKNSQSYGTVKNCIVNFSALSLTGEAKANATFGGVAGINSGAVQDCTVSGEIVADTFDVAGISYGNNGRISRCVNGADLSQTSNDSGWNPIACGIVSDNVNIVEYCENKGNIAAVSTCERNEEQPVAASAAGIVNLNRGTAAYCKNSGSVTATCNNVAYTGGITARSISRITNCISSGDIAVSANTVYAGGIMGYSEVYYTSDFFGYSFAWGAADNCICESKLSATASGEAAAYVGGIAGFINEVGIEQPAYDSDGNVIRDENGNVTTTTAYFGGGVTNCYFTGACEKQVTYFGNIVGGCAANIYSSNSYTSGTAEYHNFEGNYYVDNSLPACGAAVSKEGECTPVEDKGATAADLESIKNSEEYKNISDALLNF